MQLTWMVKLSTDAVLDNQPTATIRAVLLFQIKAAIYPC